MANKEKNMHQVKEIFRRKDQGESDRSIFRNTGFSRTTITDYLKIISICGYEPKQALSLTEEELISLIKETRKEIKLSSSPKLVQFESIKNINFHIN